MTVTLSPWLALREKADRVARSTALTRAALAALPRDRTVRILDLAAGTGSNLRYLWGAMNGPQDWLLVDADAELLAEASVRTEAAQRTVPRTTLDFLRIETRVMNLGPLDQPEIFVGRDLVTASALLDLVSEAWIGEVARHCRAVGAVALFALTYDGRFSCSPADPEDEIIRELVNRHQRNSDKGFGRAAGPDATDAAERAFTAEGYRVRRATSDWLLQSNERQLQQQLFDGWAQAARQIAPEQSALIDSWLTRQLALLDRGQSIVTVGHQDLIAVFDS
jgi:hypothetical protein